MTSPSPSPKSYLIVLISSPKSQTPSQIKSQKSCIRADTKFSGPPSASLQKISWGPRVKVHNVSWPKAYMLLVSTYLKNNLFLTSPSPSPKSKPQIKKVQIPGLVLIECKSSFTCLDSNHPSSPIPDISNVTQNPPTVTPGGTRAV